jgi:hypothetical protein
MKRLSKVLALASCVAALGLSSGTVLAQGRGNFDPAAMRQERIDRYKEQMDVKDDAEWKVIETSIGKVMDAQMDALSGRFGGFGGRGGRGNRGGGNTNSAPADTNGGNNNRRGRGGFGGTPSAEAEALQKAIDDKASADVIKTKLAALRDSNKAKEDKLESAQSDLRKMLTARQEAVAVLGGLLK